MFDLEPAAGFDQAVKGIEDAFRIDRRPLRCRELPVQLPAAFEGGCGAVVPRIGLAQVLEGLGRTGDVPRVFVDLSTEKKGVGRGRMRWVVLQGTGHGGTCLLAMAQTVLCLGQKKLDGWQMKTIGIALREMADQGFQHAEVVPLGCGLCERLSGIVGQRRIGAPNDIKGTERCLGAVAFLL